MGPANRKPDKGISGKGNPPTFNPYEEAGKIERHLSEILQENPPSTENLGVWTIFHRAVLASWNTLEEQLEHLAAEKRKKEQGGHPP